MKIAPPHSASCEAEPTHIIAICDERYPPLLRQIHDPPEELYVRGDIAALQQPQFAIVGSRRASLAALRVTQLLAGQLSQAGLGISSGLALGIDGAAHRGALDAAGKTVAVIATGIDKIYPYRHRALAAKIVQHGCIVTEFPPGTPPRKANFPQRNRIISGMSLGVLVVEAALRSGSLITARTANEQGREVFALPWSMLHTGGKGCLQLLRDGAKMVQQVDDVLEELGPLYEQYRQESGAADRQSGSPAPGDDVGAGRAQPVGSESLPETTLSKDEEKLLLLLGDTISLLDDLVSASGRPIEQVLCVLGSLEIAGHIARANGGYVRV